MLAITALLYKVYKVILIMQIFNEYIKLLDDVVQLIEQFTLFLS